MQIKQIRLLLMLITVLLLAITTSVQADDDNYPREIAKTNSDASCFTKERDAYITAAAALTTDSANLALLKAQAYHKLGVMQQTC